MQNKYLNMICASAFLAAAGSNALAGWEQPPELRLSASEDGYVDYQNPQRVLQQKNGDTTPRPYPYSDYVPMDANVILDRSNLLSKMVFDEDREQPVNIVNEYLGYDHFEEGLLGGDINIHEFYPLYYVKENLAPTYYSESFYNPFWNKAPYAKQYWFYYVNNVWVKDPIDIGDHISDWESVAYFASPESEPVEATFSTHYEARKSNWNDVEISGTAPVVYVSNGGHGSYVNSGIDDFRIANDIHTGNRESVSAANVYSLSETAKGLAVRNFSQPWGNDGKAPLGPRLRVDKARSLDFVDANNPYSGCHPYQNLPMFGHGIKMPQYGVPIVEDFTNQQSDSVVQEVINYGPYRWSSGYFEDGECKEISAPESVNTLSMRLESNLNLTWNDSSYNKDDAVVPFGYVVSVYQDKEKALGKVSTVVPWLEKCSSGTCQLSLNPVDYGVTEENSESLCVSVRSFNPAGHSTEIDTCQTPTLSLVIDDTGSMRDELELVKSKMITALNNFPAENAMYQLVSFKDAANERIMTREKSEIIDVVSSLYPAGGDDCAESSGAALLLAAKAVAEGGSVIFATDASSSDSKAFRRAKKQISKKGANLTILLSGVCDDSAPASVSAPEITALQDVTESAPNSIQAEIPSSASTFDGLDWEPDAGISNYRSIMVNDINSHRYIGFAQEDGQVDSVDTFDAVMVQGSYSISVLQYNNNHRPLFVEVFSGNAEGETIDEDSLTLLASGRVQDQYNHSYQWTIDANIETEQLLFIKVSAESILDTPTQYEVQIVDNPYAALSDYKAYEQFAEDCGSQKFYYVPEIKRGDSTRFEEALEEAFQIALIPKIGAVTPSELYAKNSVQNISISMINKTWDGSETVTLENDAGESLSLEIESLADSNATFNVHMSSRVSAGCYSLTVATGEHVLEKECVVTVIEVQQNISELIDQLEQDISSAEISIVYKTTMVPYINFARYYTENEQYNYVKTTMNNLILYVSLLKGNGQVSDVDTILETANMILEEAQRLQLEN